MDDLAIKRLVGARGMARVDLVLGGALDTLFTNNLTEAIEMFGKDAMEALDVLRRAVAREAPIRIDGADVGLLQIINEMAEAYLEEAAQEVL
jgi:hypothetical protein